MGFWRSPKSLSFRAAKPGDLERLVAIHASAFPDPRNLSERRTNFTHNVRGRLQDLVVAEQAGEIYGHAFLFESAGFFGGSECAVGAIATVGVAPEARGQGIGRALVDELHRKSAVRGDVLTLLYPFRTSFYAPLGYGPVSTYRRLAISPHSIPKAWADLPKKRAIRAMSPSDRKPVEALYEEVARTKTGRIRRSAALWERAFVDERRVWFVALRAEKIVGYVSWSIRQLEAHARTSLFVHEGTAKDDATKRLLFGLISAQRDQVSDVFLDLDAKDPLDLALLDPDAHVFGTLALEHPFGEVATGPLVRLHDPKHSLEARGYFSDGRVVVKIGNAAPLEIRIQSGKAKTHSTREKPALSLDRRVLASILFGAISPSDAAAVGLCTIHRDAAELDRIFALPPFFALDPF
ncbi:MAG: GNAT family N-acetyltransferase [Polyangiaceae bacterium]